VVYSNLVQSNITSLASPLPPLTCTRLPRLRGQNGDTSLMFASAHGHVEVVRVLIDMGANLEAVNKVRIHSHATTHARSQTLTHTHTCTHLPVNAQSSLV
jgi:ankyrin repeat protein